MKKPLRDRIDERMDMLESMMHTWENEPSARNDLADPIIELCSSVSKFWSVLSGEDRDYIQYARERINVSD
jgi:hypothetical protein